VIVCQLQDCKERRCHDHNKKLEKEPVAILQESTRDMHPLSNFANDFDLVTLLTKSTGSTASLQIYGKCMANLITFYLITFYLRNSSRMALFSDTSGTPNIHPPIHTHNGKSNLWQWHRPWSCRSYCHFHRFFLQSFSILILISQLTAPSSMEEQ
jgi:hypothetical protein